MKYLLFFCVCLLYGIVVFAQTDSTVIIKGMVRDSLKNEPLAYVTVTVNDAKTNEAVKATLTKDNGSFEVRTKKDKQLLLVLAYVGYNERKIEISTNNGAIDLGIILLTASSSQLKDVVVTATRPIIKQEVDRIVFDVQADPENKVNNVLDMLRKVPLVSVDGSDNIKLKGTSNYKILINGKPSSLIASNPSDVFKSMPATNIIKIEVITTPPAKYDAEGLSGIINIITKRNIAQGYNGSINTRFNSVYGPGINLNATLKQGKFGLNGYVGYNKRNNQAVKEGYTSVIIHPVSSSVIQNGERSTNGYNTYGNAELSYEMDSLNLITASIETYNGSSDNNSNQLSRLLNSNNSLAQQYRLFNSGNSGNQGTDLAVNYELGFKKVKEQLLTTSYKYSSSGNKQNNTTAFFDRTNYAAPDYRQYNNSGTKEHTVQLDYVYPIKLLNIEAGAKAILRKNFSEFTTDHYSDILKEYINQPLQTNNFVYHQDVYSVYNSYQLKLKKVVLKAGLRLEHTTVNANFSSTSNGTKKQYDNLVPSVSFQRNLKDNTNFTFGFSQRIQRPGIWQLNPFIDRSNPKFIEIGNPDLKPVVNQNIELGYSNFSKGSINAGISYSFAENTVENVTSVGADTVTTTTYLNVGSNRGLSVNLNMNYPFTPKLTVDVNAQLLHVWLKGTFNNQFYNNHGFQGHIFTYTTYKFNKGYRASLNLGFDSRYVLLQGTDNYYIFSSLSGSKTLFKEKATLSLAINNPTAKFIRLDFYTNSDSFKQMNYNDNYYRTINVSFNYKFGKLSSSIKKNQRGISNDDVNSNSSRQ